MAYYEEPELTLYLAGERAAAGFYRRLDAEVTVHLEQEDFLPASLDGQVACYFWIDPARHLFSNGAAVAKAGMKFEGSSNVQEDTRVR